MATNPTNATNATVPPVDNAEQTPTAPNSQAPPEDEEAPIPPPPTATEARLPTEKDTSLREFVGKMDDYAPIVCASISCFYSVFNLPGRSPMQ